VSRLLPDLAIADRNRYTDHTYMVFTLQKLVHLHEDEDSDSEIDEKSSSYGARKPPRSKVSKFFRNIFSGSKSKFEDKQRRASMVAGVHDPDNGFVTAHTEGIHDAPVQKLRTLQRYHGGPNKARMEYMERHSPLTKKRLAISAEQVSVFLTSGIS
jgi:hypothetical protein